MATKITKEFLQEHFRKHDAITLYKPDGTPGLSQILCKHRRAMQNRAKII